MSEISQGNKRIAKNTLFMYMRFFVTLIVGLYTSRVVLLVLGVSDYGLYSVVGGVLAMFTFISTSLGGATTRFLNFEMGKPDGDVNRTFNVNVVLHFAMAAIILIVGEIGGLFYIYNYLNVEQGRLSDAVFVYEVTIITACLGINNTPFNSLFTSHEKFGFLALLDVTNVLVRLGLIVMLQFYEGNVLRLYAFIMAFTTISNFIIYRIFAKRWWPEIIKYKFVKTWSLYKETISFGWWNLLSTLAVMVRSSGSDMLINSFYGTAVNGAYAISRTVSNYALNATSYIDSSSVPQITQSYSSNDIQRYSYLTNMIGRINLLLFALVFFPLYIELEFILQLWLKDVPEGVLLLTQLNLILSYVSLTSSGVVTLINATGNVKWFKIMMSLFFILCIPAGYFLLKMGMPYYTMVVLFIIADVLHRIVQFILVKRIIKYDIVGYMKEAFLRPLAIIVVMSVVIYVYGMIGCCETIIQKLLAIIICFMITASLVFFIGLKHNERNKVMSFLNKKLKR